MPEGLFAVRLRNGLIVVEGDSANQWTKMWCNGIRAAVGSSPMTYPVLKVLPNDMILDPVMRISHEAKDNEKSFKLPIKQKTYYVPQQHVRTRQFKRDNSKYHR